jgi:hypothetical protein
MAKLFIRKLQLKFRNLKYICVCERHKSGQIHYHLLAIIPYVDKAEIQRMWVYGASRIDAVDSNENMGSYLTKMTNEMSKYLTKDHQSFFKGHKRYFCSKGVQIVRVSMGTQFIKNVFYGLNLYDAGQYSFDYYGNTGLGWWFMNKILVRVDDDYL